MDLLKIKALIDMMATSDLLELEIAENGWTLRLARASKNTTRSTQTQRASSLVEPPATTAPVESSGSQISSAVVADAADVQAPLSGVIHLAPGPGKPPFVMQGQTVKAGTTVCVIEAMKVLNEVRAARDGKVETIHVESGAEVDAGQPLMRIA